MENYQFCADVWGHQTETYSWKFCVILKSGAQIHFSHFSASAAVPHLSQQAPKAPQHLAVTLLPVRKTRLKANSSFILEIMKKSGRDSSENFGKNDEYSRDVLCA